MPWHHARAGMLTQHPPSLTPYLHPTHHPLPTPILAIAAGHAAQELPLAARPRLPALVTTCLPTGCSLMTLAVRSSATAAAPLGHSETLAH